MRNIVETARTRPILVSKQIFKVRVSRKVGRNEFSTAHKTAVSKSLKPPIYGLRSANQGYPKYCNGKGRKTVILTPTVVMESLKPPIHDLGRSQNKKIQSILSGIVEVTVIK